MADTASRSRMSLYCDVFIVLASHIDEVVSVRTTDSSEFFLCWATIFRKKYVDCSNLPISTVSSRLRESAKRIIVQ